MVWYRLASDVAPWGRVYLWGQLPDDWVLGFVPLIAPAAGTLWTRVPYSVGHVGEPAGNRELELHACPVLARPAPGRLTDASGRAWHRVEFRQIILWTPADAVRLRMLPACRLLRPAASTAGRSSCELVVM